MIALGIEIGGTKLQAGIGDDHAGLLALARRPVDQRLGAVGIRAVLDGIVDEAILQAGCNRADISGAGIGFGGPYDTTRDVALHSFQIAGWDGFPLRAWAEQRWSVPVVVRNDAAVAGLGETRFGAARGYRRVFYLTIGSGIGGGWIVDGRIDVGQGLGAAEIGHTWVPTPGGNRPEELEQLCSGWSIGRRARDAARQQATSMVKLAGTVDAIDARIVYRAATEGDLVATHLISETCATLGIAIANVISLLHPEIVVIGGGVSLMGPLFWDQLRREVRKHALPPFVDRVQIVQAKLGEAVVIIGALSLVFAQ